MVRKLTILFAACGLMLTCLLFVTCSKTKSSGPVYVTDCADSLTGIYNGSDYCSSSSQPSYTCSITAATPTNITFSNLGGAVNVTAVLDCSKNTISIPSQTFPNNVSISGTGTFTRNRIIINWTGLLLGSPVSCSSTLTR